MIIGCGAVVGEGVKVGAAILGLGVDVRVGGGCVAVTLGSAVRVKVEVAAGISVGVIVAAIDVAVFVASKG
jgi:hypothetical protein